ncbi:uncharacterized protein [Amphiura filiformis]|uniref:uncharacterized protein n=1 Tax=Amphiura filiformis TaxID=82378 RepID=UPI003B20B793
MSFLRMPRMRKNTDASLTTFTDAHIVKVVLMGAARAGKTSLLTRLLVDDYYPAYLPTLEPAAYKPGSCVYRLEKTVGKKSIAFDFYDTPGFYQSPPMREFLFALADVFILVYAIDEYRSFQEICSILKEIRHKRPGANVLFIGSKTDLNAYRDITYDDVVKFGSSLGIEVFETSAKVDRSLYSRLMKYLQPRALFELGNADTSLKFKIERFFTR